MKHGTVVSVGTFDGVHLGHQAILRELRCQARAQALPSLVYAFSVPPRWVIRGDEDRYLLLPASVKRDLLRDSVDIVHPVSFETICSMDPEEFVSTVLIEQLKARTIVEGETFRFGRDRSVVVADEAASSTRIRDSVRSGDFDTARLCLGRSPVLLGTVGRGDHLGGKLGYPTANLAIDPHVLLPHPGIFLVHAYGQDIRSGGLLYIGSRPTLGSRDLRCEAHLLDFPQRTLYGESLEIHLLEKVRDDRAFPSLDELRSQIGADIAVARQLLLDYPLSGKRISS